MEEAERLLRIVAGCCYSAYDAAISGDQKRTIQSISAALAVALHGIGLTSSTITATQTMRLIDEAIEHFQGEEQDFGKPT